MSAHAILSASGSKRWLTCTPSPLLEQQFPESKSEYAEEGSFAHALAELKLSKALTYIRPSEYKKRLEEMKQSPYFSPSMEEYIDQYIAFVGEKYMAAKKDCSDTRVLLEQRLDFSEWVPEGFGTGDVIIIADGVLEIVDLKYGQGVPVSAEDNTQMKLYALGAISQFGLLYDFDCVRMTIVQPRLDSISTEDSSVSELLIWGNEYVKPKAKDAIEGKGGFHPGDHCQFCRAKATCRARAESNLEMAKYDFQEPLLLTNEEISDILAKAEALQKWAKDIQDYALDQAENHGVKFPGWKLVEGRSNRKYSDEDAVATKLKAEGYASDVIYQPQKLWGITEMESRLGKKIFSEYLKDLIVKPSGKPALVPESDKRPEINSVQSAINDFTENILD